MNGYRASTNAGFEAAAIGWFNGPILRNQKVRKSLANTGQIVGQRFTEIFVDYPGSFDTFAHL